MKNILSLVLNSALAAAIALPMFAQTAPAPAATTSKTTATTKTTKAKPAATPAPTAQEIADAQAKGLVWVNLNSKVYHTSGAYYGKTKQGKFMTAQDAEKAGYKAAKEPAAKKTTAKATTAPKK
jgi:hypothetical protein